MLYLILSVCAHIYALKIVANIFSLLYALLEINGIIYI